MFFKRKKRNTEIGFDEVIPDLLNLSSFNVHQMEGRLEKPIGKRSVFIIGSIFGIIVAVFLVRLFMLQVVNGEEYAAQSTNNMLRQSLIVAERGIVYDRNGELLAWNELDHTGQYDFPIRAYTDRRGLGQLIGYVSYPQKDSAGFYYRTEYLGRTGVEKSFHDFLQGENGVRLVELTAHGEVLSESATNRPRSGGELTLSLDAELSEHMFDLIATSTIQQGFRSGAGAIMDVETGEIIAMTSFPSYDPEILSDGDDVEAIEALNTDERYPFLNKVTGGAYIPGSIVKPFVAYAALAEGIISPYKEIYSDGAFEVPNPYNPDKPTIFRDWRAHGWTDARTAIAYSANVYFYTIGGGVEGEQEGLGITRINKYMHLFGIGEKTGIALEGEASGNVPSPEWKMDVFDDDWRLGDTYLTSIGQFGFQATPIQMLRAYAAIANGGTLVTPQVVLGARGEEERIDIDEEALQIVREGMRQTVVQDGGTARPLEREDVAIAAKSGTAEVGVANEFVNSWIAGYFPYEEPKYAFILFMEHGPRANTLSAGRIMSWVFDWMGEHRTEYFVSS
ncbi:hypothetical protein KTR10_03150 [Candidatus Kaiserbacteria bacterium]|nr:hypothetical protein [Candidatus Kaiserbacteria bacterium]